MKRLLLIPLLLLLISPLIAQQILWGVTYSGGTVNSTGNGKYGTLLKYDPIANNISYPQNFYAPIGTNPEGTPAVLSDGNVYGTNASSGVGTSYGKLWKFNTSTSTMSVIHSFSASTGQYPHGNIIEASNGKAYGVTEGGGANSLGVIYEIDIANATYTKKFDLTSAGGSKAMTGLLDIGSNKLLGTTQMGGTNNLGVIFEYDYSTNTYTKKIDFAGASNGSKPWGAIIKAPNGKFYGLTSTGGTNDVGVLYEYDYATNTLTVKQHLSATLGSNPKGSLFIAGDGMMYGMAEFGGVNNKGTLFQYDYVSNTLTKKIDFDGAGNGAQPNASLVENDGRLFGMTSRGGAANNGTIFQYDYNTSTLTKKSEWNTHLYGNGFPFMSSFSIQTCPEVTVTAQPVTDTVCTSGSALFVVKATGTNLTYQWQVKSGAGGYTDLVDNTTYSGISNDTLTINAGSTLNGNYYRCKISSSGCSSYSDKATLVVTSDPVIVPSVTVAITEGSSFTCSDVNVKFKATPNNGGSAPHYQWQVNGVNVGTNSDTYSSTSLTHNSTVKVIMTSNAVCASPSSATSSTTTMNVTTTVTPLVSIAITSGSASICTGTSVTFEATATHGGSTPVYQWKINGVNEGNNSPTFTSTTLANGDKVTCQLTSNAACKTSPTANSNQITMSVSSPETPSIAIAITSGNNPSCSGSSVTFTATATNGGTTPSYTWKKNTDIVGNNSSTYTSNSLADDDVIICVLTSNTVCATSTIATSTGITMDITPSVTPAISISITSGDDYICKGTEVTFTAAISDGGSSPVYQWKADGNNVGNNSATFTSSSLTNFDEVTCTLTSNVTCASNSAVESDPIEMSVDDAVTAHAGNDQNAMFNFASLEATAPATGTGTWTRINGSGTIFNANSHITSVSGLGNGINTFRWTVENGLCSAFDDVVITVGPTATTNGYAAGHSLAPNPFVKETVLNIYSSFSGSVMLKVKDAQGSTLKSFEGRTNENIEFGQDLSTGMYIVEAIYDNQFLVFKVIKSE